MAYQKPQAIIHQKFETVPNISEGELRAVIVGPNAILHRYADSDEKGDTYIGIYNPLADVVLDDYPGRSAGGIVDYDYSKLFVDNALLQYFNSTDYADDYEFTNKENYDNVIISDTAGKEFRFASCEASSRSDVLGIRDVAIGDYVEVTGSTQTVEGECIDVDPILSRVVGYVNVTSEQYIEDPTINGPETTTANNAFKVYVNDSDTSADATALAGYVAYEGNFDFLRYGIMHNRADGKLELYSSATVTVASFTKTSNCGRVIKLRVTNKETEEEFLTQIQADKKVIITKYGMPDTTSGSTVTNHSPAITIATDASSTAETPKGWDFFVKLLEDGKSVKFTVVETPAYTKVYNDPEAATPVEMVKLGSEAAYNGSIDDKYVIECVTGAAIEAETGPVVNIYTAYGQDTVKGIVITNKVYQDKGIAIGYRGLTLSFASTVEKLCAGTTIYVKVVGEHVLGVQGIALADDLPSDLRYVAGGAPKINIRLIAKKNVELPEISPFNKAANWGQEATQILIYKEATTADSEFLYLDGSSIPLKLYGYGNDAETKYHDFSKMYFQYREWSPVHAFDCDFCDTISNLDNIVGPLTIDNPLKWAVYKALTNSNGVAVGYVAVKNPDDLDDWQDAISILEGNDNVYTVVPLTTELEKQNLVVTLINTESSAEACRWKTALFNMELPEEKMVVGQSANNATNPTSTDGNAVIGKFVDNPEETGTQYTKFVCTSGNSGFVDFGVEPGDELRVISGADNTVAASYVVDQVYSNTTLILVTGPRYTMDEARVEIWHAYSKNEEVALIKDRAQAFASRRIGLVWPDIVTEDTVAMPGYFLSAALAGLKSGVDPQAGLTRRTIQGFDGMSRSKPRYTETQLDSMAESGVWVCVEDNDGTVQSRHALTTDTTSTFYSEEMMTRNFDSVSKYMYQVIDTYIGTSNVTTATLVAIYNELITACNHLIGKGQMINYTDLTVKQHDLLLDRVVAYLNVGLPFAVNNVELYITAERYNLGNISLTKES